METTFMTIHSQYSLSLSLSLSTLEPNLAKMPCWAQLLMRFAW